MAPRQVEVTQVPPLLMAEPRSQTPTCEELQGDREDDLELEPTLREDLRLQSRGTTEVPLTQRTGNHCSRESTTLQLSPSEVCVGRFRGAHASTGSTVQL